jgi:3-methylcrotonyl-CoA carboxylase alpha subunit
MMFQKILIANRGEIACRIMATARKMSISTVAVYSDADRHARHVRMADEAVFIGGSPAKESYLNIEAILAAVRETGADAVHPGYGFLSENIEFANACAAAGITFIGPSARSIEQMGLKDHAKAIMERAGVPVVPGYMGENQDPDFLLKQAQEIGFPVLIKAVAGGGGKGMRYVDEAKDFLSHLASCQREALSSFANDHVLIEKFISKPRHVEVQVFGDEHGNAVHLFERDCSLQRRHQKVVEEAPAPHIPEKVRAQMGADAVKAVKALGYVNAGTIEYIMDSSTHEYYFMEMNTRLQVEHPVTEMITGLDLVEWQLRVAAGEELPLKQSQIHLKGHAFEVRLYAEDPAQNFIPQIGEIIHFMKPDNVRLDTAVDVGDKVTIFYDPMIAKIIVHGETREDAARKMLKALIDTKCAGVRTNQEFLYNIFNHKPFLNGRLSTAYISENEVDLIPENYGLPSPQDFGAIAAYQMASSKIVNESHFNDIWDKSDSWRLNGSAHKQFEYLTRQGLVSLTAKMHRDIIDVNVLGHDVIVMDPSARKIIESKSKIYLCRDNGTIDVDIPRNDVQNDGVASEGRIAAPMPGKIIHIMVSQGDSVEKDQPVIIMEAMKMEMTIKAGCDGIVDELPVGVNDQVIDGSLLVLIKAKSA